MLVAREKPGFQALSKGLTVLLCLRPSSYQGHQVKVNAAGVSRCGKGNLVV